MKKAPVHHTIILDSAVNCAYGTISKDVSIIQDDGSIIQYYTIILDDGTIILAYGDSIWLTLSYG